MAPFPQEVEEVDATGFLFFGGMILQYAGHVDVDVITFTDAVCQVMEEEIGGEGRVGVRIQSDRPSLQRRKQRHVQVLHRGIRHPQDVGKQLTQHYRTRLALHDGDGFRV